VAAEHLADGLLHCGLEQGGVLVVLDATCLTESAELKCCARRAKMNAGLESAELLPRKPIRGTSRQATVLCGEADQGAHHHRIAARLPDMLARALELH
jgi:hypothetical protein